MNKKTDNPDMKSIPYWFSRSLTYDYERNISSRKSFPPPGGIITLKELIYGALFAVFFLLILCVTFSG